MTNDILPIIRLTLRHALPFIYRLLSQKLQATIHRFTYHATPAPRTVVVIGASYAGLQVARRLTETLPTGYRVVLIERKEALHWVFSFPRFSVLEGYEEMAFVPYTGLERGAVEGVLERRRGRVVRVSDEGVVVEGVEGGQEVVGWDFLVVATGCEQNEPARLSSGDIEGACEELRGMQQRIKAAAKIAVVGGGAVGVELASDVKDVYPEKEVVLVHSRGQLLNTFGSRLHEHALATLEKLGVKVILGERPVVSEVVEGRSRTLTFSDDKTEEFDLIIPCTGQRPNSSLLGELAPESISKQTQRILVNGNMQICDSDLTVHNSTIFALGDVAETGAPKMARATMMQGETVVDNILSMIRDGKPSTTYVPQTDLEGTIKLTLGVKENAMWMQEPNGRELLITSKSGKADMDVAMGWTWYGPGKKEMPKRKTSWARGRGNTDLDAHTRRQSVATVTARSNCS